MTARKKQGKPAQGVWQDRAAALPWVRRRKFATQCVCWRSGRPRLRSRQPLDQEAYEAKWKCKQPAYWTFKPRPSAGSWQDRGPMCWSHLVSRGIYGSMEEDIRADRWWRKNGWRCVAISPEGSQCVRWNYKDGLAEHTDHHTSETRSLIDGKWTDWEYGEQWTST